MPSHFSLYTLCPLNSIECVLLILLYYIVLALSIQSNSTEEIADADFLLFICTYNALVLSFVPAELFLNVFLNDITPARQPKS